MCHRRSVACFIVLILEVALLTQATRRAHSDKTHPPSSHRDSIDLDADYEKLLRSFGVEDDRVPASRSVNYTDQRLDSSSGIFDERFGRTTSSPATGKHNQGLNYPPKEDCRMTGCGHGRICRNQNGRPECICREKCPTKKHHVCGTDGKLYENYCELHRTACLTSRLIRVDTESMPVSGEAGGRCQRKIKADFSKESSTKASVHPTTLVTFSASCTETEYGKFKEKLMLYFYDRLAALYRLKDSSINKYAILQDMMKAFDADADERLSQHEFQDHFEESLKPFSGFCNLEDLLRNEDSNANNVLEIQEIYHAYGLPDPEAHKIERHKSWSVVSGNSIALRCDLPNPSSDKIIWERYQVQLTPDEEAATGIRLDRPDTLYLTHAQLTHAGNYSCFLEQSPDERLTHSLTVTMIPAVQIRNHQRFYHVQDSVALKCHAVGVPEPNIKWKKNDVSVEYSKGAGSSLEFPSLQLKDTGTYTCLAENSAGTSMTHTSLFVEDQLDTIPAAPMHYLAVLHSHGISVHDPEDCQARFAVRKNHVIPGTANDHVCGHETDACEWGEAVNVLDKFLFASQPKLNRIIVMSLEDMMIVQTIPTDPFPVKLFYVTHLDQIWIVCWNSQTSNSEKTIMVIRDASKRQSHSAIHSEPLDGHLVQVDDLFIPPAQELAHKLYMVYATNGNSLLKIDMRSLKVVKKIRFEEECRPRKVTYSAIGGRVLIDCQGPLDGSRRYRLEMDYLTDAIIRRDDHYAGLTYISPDDKFLINEDNDLVLVDKISEHGPIPIGKIKPAMHLADMTFHPTASNFSYEVFATSLTTDRLVIMNLDSSRVETISGIGYGDSRKHNQWGLPGSRFIRSSGVFGNYVAVGSKTSVSVVNIGSKTISCRTNDLVGPQIGVWFQYPSLAA